MCAICIVYFEVCPAQYRFRRPLASPLSRANITSRGHVGWNAQEKGNWRAFQQISKGKLYFESGLDSKTMRSEQNSRFLS